MRSKAIVLVGGSVFALSCGAAGDPESILRTVNDRLAKEFISHDGLLLDYVGEIPTPEEIADLKPNAMGWWCPIENGSMFTGEWLPALMAEGPSRRALVERCVRGLVKMSEISDVPGFIARGTGTDGKSHHPCGSNDQTDPWFLGLCEYCRWAHADPTLKAKALERLVVVAKALEANGWGVPCDGPFKGQDRGNLNAKKMPFWGKTRLLYSLKSLQLLTGDRHWGEVYDGLKASALDEIESGGEVDAKTFKACYGTCVWIYLSSAQALARLIEMEESAEDRARMQKGLSHYAGRVAPLMKNRAKYANTTERPFKYANWRTGYAWRVQKTQKEAEQVAASGKREILGTRKGYERNGMANPLCAAAVCALSGKPKYRDEILATLRHYDYSTPNISEFFHAAVAAAALSPLGTETVIVHWERPVGIVKPVNGVGQPPMLGQLAGWPMMHYLKEAGVPYSRLHDVGGWMGKGLYVDIPNLFPNSDSNEDDPKNYRFAYTDDLIAALVKNGIEPFFRLGVTIENFVERGLPPVRCRPPEDFAKWARICEHVIRHYTEGWANGFRYPITYWEIWNEPDNRPDSRLNPCWNGSFDEFIRFYGTVAPYLKTKFPSLRIGGYASCGFYAGVGAEQVKAANSSPRLSYFVNCATNFLANARANGWPLDFFSFHSYSAPEEALRQVRYADELLTRYGFDRGKTERVFNEWLPYVGHGNLGSDKQAAGIAAELIGLQNGPCDVACLYDARCDVGNYSPLFNPMTLKPHRAYAAFLAFNELRRCGTAVAVRAPAELQVAAARGRNGAAVMIANDSDVARPLACDFGSRKVLSCRLTDATHVDDVVPLPSKLAPHSFAVILLDCPEDESALR